MTADAVAYVYPDGSPALEGLSLEIHEGETLGLLGPNGSGKSTFLRLLAGEDAEGIKRSGSVADARDRWLAPDQPVFRPWLTGRENAIGLLELHGAGREAKSAADRWIARFGLEDDAARPAATYSAGMRRRLALAVAFGAGARLLLLDEPLAGLDPIGRTLFAEALEERREGGGTLVFSAHDPDFAAARCDRVAFIIDGRCEIAETPERLVASIGQRPRLEVRFVEGGRPDPGGLGPRPPAVASVTWGQGIVQLEVDDPGRALPAALAWLLEGDAGVASVDVRRPTLGDAFFALTGQPLTAEPA